MQQALVERAQRGDPEAFRELVAESADRLYAIAWRILRDPDRAEDALQQALIAIWHDLPELRDPARFDAWAFRLVVRASYREAKHGRRWTSHIAEIRLDPPTGDRLERVLDRDELAHAFGRLSAEHRGVLVLHYYAGLSMPEVARTLGIPAGTAGSRLHYAIRSLRAALEAEGRAMVTMGRSA